MNCQETAMFFPCWEEAGSGVASMKIRNCIITIYWRSDTAASERGKLFWKKECTLIFQRHLPSFQEAAPMQPFWVEMKRASGITCSWMWKNFWGIYILAGAGLWRKLPGGSIRIPIFSRTVPIQCWGIWYRE